MGRMMDKGGERKEDAGTLAVRQQLMAGQQSALLTCS